MTTSEFLALYPKVSLTWEEIACCRHLERQGQRFLVDFGYGNAPAKVWRQLDEAYADRYPDELPACLL